jgi:hypothetical protein
LKIKNIDKAMKTVRMMTILVAVMSILMTTYTTIKPKAMLEAQADEDDDGDSSGLKVFVNLYHNGRDFAELCVYSYKEDLGCDRINLSRHDSPIQWGPRNFSSGIVKVGESYIACVTNLNTGVERCNGGLNGLPEEPEHISLRFPGSQGSNSNNNEAQQSSQRSSINWMQICNYYDKYYYIIEPCGMLVTPDGHGVTIEGLSMLSCFASTALITLYPELLDHSYMCERS